MTEILVVILIIGVLSAILVPALAVGRAKARQTACASNLRQMGLAFSLYAGDWRNVLPHEDASIPAKTAAQCGVDLPALCVSAPDCPYCWFFALDQYLSQRNADRLAQIKQDPIFQNITGEARATTRTFKMNDRLEDRTTDDDNCNPRFRDVGTINAPGQTVLLFDGRIYNGTVASWYKDGPSGVDQRHSGGANFLFVSGRVTWVKQAEQSGLVWNP